MRAPAYRQAAGSVVDYDHLATAYRVWRAYEDAFDAGPTPSLAMRCDEAWLELAGQAVNCDRGCLRQPSLLGWIERRVEQTDRWRAVSVHPGVAERGGQEPPSSTSETHERTPL